MSVLAYAPEATMLLAKVEDKTRGPEFGKASPMGLLVIILLLAAVFLLIRSMNSQLRKLPDSFDQDNPEPDQKFDEGTDRVEPDAEPDTAAPDESVDDDGPPDDVSDALSDTESVDGVADSEYSDEGGPGRA